MPLIDQLIMFGKLLGHLNFNNNIVFIEFEGVVHQLDHGKFMHAWLVEDFDITAMAITPNRRVSQYAN
jgi:hypothetical protein